MIAKSPNMCFRPSLTQCVSLCALFPVALLPLASCLPAWSEDPTKISKLASYSLEPKFDVLEDFAVRPPLFIELDQLFDLVAHFPPNNVFF